MWGRRSSHLVPGDEILRELQPHNHTGYVWLIRGEEEEEGTSCIELFFSHCFVHSYAGSI
jgi:hypothetical protein